MFRLSNLDSRQRVILIISLSVLAVFFSLIFPRFFVVSITKSLSHRLYWLDKDTAKIKYGDYVLFRHSDVATQFIEQTMIKLVKCDEGDVLTVNEKKELYCNNAFIGRAKDKALNGKKLVNFVWNGPVPPGMFLPMGDHKDSYDGRYYGFLPKSKVLKKAHPVF